MPHLCFLLPYPTMIGSAQFVDSVTLGDSGESGEFFVLLVVLVTLETLVNLVILVN